MDDHVIQTRGLTRCFGSRTVVSDLDLAVPRGCIFRDDDFLGIDNVQQLQVHHHTQGALLWQVQGCVFKLAAASKQFVDYRQAPPRT